MRTIDIQVADTTRIACPTFYNAREDRTIRYPSL